MSRHSHWAKIKRGKGTADAVRGQVCSKLARVIAVAARAGGGDPAFNVKLRLAMDRAKAAAMSKDAIERAIARGTGAEADAATFEAVLYEGFAPGGAAVLIECLTDNRNRTLGEVKAVFRDHGATLGGEGSVQWQFERRGIVSVTGSLPESVELMLMEAGAEDIRHEDAQTTIHVQAGDLSRVREVAERVGLTVTDAGLAWVPTQLAEVADIDRARCETFIESLDALDDVQEVSTNARDNASPHAFGV